MPDQHVSRNPEAGTSISRWMVFKNPYEGGQWVGVLAYQTGVSIKNGFLTHDIYEVYGSGGTVYEVTGTVRVYESMADAVYAINGLSSRHLCFVTAHSEGEMRLSAPA